MVANGAKRFLTCPHRVPAHCAVDMNIDKSRREITAFKVDNLFAHRRGLPPNCSDHPVFDEQIESIANAVRKNQSPVLKDHRESLSKSLTRVNTSSENPSDLLN